MRKNQILAFSLAISCMGIYTGCSYQKIDNAIQQKIEPEEQLPTFISPEIPDDNIIYVKNGAYVSDYYEYQDENGTLNTMGIDGLEFQVEDVSVFDTVSETSIPTEELHKLSDDETEVEKAYENNGFILLKVNARYTNLSGDASQDEIMFWNDLKATYRWGDDYEEFVSDGIINCEPRVVYFDKHIREGDVDLNGEALDAEHDYNMCRESIRDGESVSFELGVLVSHELLEQKNVFLFANYDEPPSDDPIYYLDILGRYAEQGTTES